MEHEITNNGMQHNAADERKNALKIHGFIYA